MSHYCNSDKEAEELNVKEVYQVRVCNGHDDLSRITYKKLIEEHKDLPFFKKIAKRYGEKDQGTIIRWLYRGLSMEQTLHKIDKQRDIRKLCVNKALAKQGK